MGLRWVGALMDRGYIGSLIEEKNSESLSKGKTDRVYRVSADDDFLVLVIRTS